MNFGKEPFEAKILNTGQIVHNWKIKWFTPFQEDLKTMLSMNKAVFL